MAPPLAGFSRHIAPHPQRRPLWPGLWGRRQPGHGSLASAVDVADRLCGDGAIHRRQHDRPRGSLSPRALDRRLDQYALTPHVKGAPRRLYPIIAQLLTDESFAVSMAQFERWPSDPWFFIGSGLAIFIPWQIVTALGAAFGAGLPAGWGLEYALPGSLICLVFLLVRGRRAALVSLLAAGLSLLLRPVVSGTWSTMAATVVAASLGVAWKRWQSRS